MILLLALQFLTDFAYFELLFIHFTIICACQHHRIIDEVVKAILMDSNSENVDCIPDNDLDFGKLDSESGSFD